ncbi:MAG: sigma-54-dependent Fis family transcriptional regulator [Actinomycetales bacterium]
MSSSAAEPVESANHPVGTLSNTEILSLRERFLADPVGTRLTSLRPVIARSWERSMSCKVNANASLLDTSEPLVDEQLLMAAEPVLTELEKLCVDTGGSVVLTDAQGTLAVFRGDSAEKRKAERIFPTFGGNMAEDLIGTNADGTALEEGGAVQVWGPEHFNEAFHSSYCTSTPIRDPIRRSVRGVIGIMLPERVGRSASPQSILLTVHAAAAEITRRLAERLAAREQALMSEYLREVRKRGADAVVAMDERTTIASRSALSMLEQNDFAVLAALARETAPGTTASHRLSVQAGREVLLQIRPMDFRDLGTTGAAVMRLQMPGSATRSRRSAVPTRDHSHFAAFVGTSRTLRRALDAAAAAVSRRTPAYIVGEKGTGKQFLAETMAALLRDDVQVFEFSSTAPSAATVDAVDTALAQGSAVVVHRVDLASDEFKGDFTGLLSVLEQPQLVLTAGTVRDDLLPILAALRGIEVSMPPLRARREDIPALASHFLGQFTEREVRLSPKLRDALVAADWPGNVNQLRELMKSIASARGPLSEARLADLSAVQLRALSTARLTRLEEAELQQIRAALSEANGNRVRAASLLGIGRSTLYRKIEAYQGRGVDIELG